MAKLDKACAKQIHKNAAWTKNMSEPGRWNITGYDNAWKEYPEDLDFLSKKSGHYYVKDLERDIYLETLEPFISGLKKMSSVLDAACGIGRFAIPLAKRGHIVSMVDGCEKNLELAIAHLAENNVVDNAELYLGNISNLQMFKNETFDMTLGIEAICYCSSPEEALKELVRVTKKGGLIVISVEGKYGSLISDENISSEYFDSTYATDELRIKNHTFTKYYSQAELETLTKNAGIRIISSRGCNYVPNGILHRLTAGGLQESEYKNKLLKIERLCREDSTLNNLARVWIVIGVVEK